MWDDDDQDDFDGCDRDEFWTMDETRASLDKLGLRGKEKYLTDCLSHAWNFQGEDYGICLDDSEDDAETIQKLTTLIAEMPVASRVRILSASRAVEHLIGSDFQSRQVYEGYAPLDLVLKTIREAETEGKAAILGGDLTLSTFAKYFKPVFEEAVEVFKAATVQEKANILSGEEAVGVLADAGHADEIAKALRAFTVRDREKILTSGGALASLVIYGHKETVLPMFDALPTEAKLQIDDDMRYTEAYDVLEQAGQGDVVIRVQLAAERAQLSRRGKPGGNDFNMC